MFTNKKWFILAVIGANIAIFGLIFLFMMVFINLNLPSSQLIEMNLLFYYIIDEYLDIPWEVLFLISYSRQLRVMRIIKLGLFYSGIGILAIGGFLALLGLTRYIQLEKQLKKEGV